MNQKPLLLAITLIALLVIAGAFWYLQQRQVAVNQPIGITEPVVETLVLAEPEKYSQHIVVIPDSVNVWYEVPELDIKLLLSKTTAGELVYRHYVVNSFVTVDPQTGKTGEPKRTISADFSLKEVLRYNEECKSGLCGTGDTVFSITRVPGIYNNEMLAFGCKFLKQFDGFYLTTGGSPQAVPFANEEEEKKFNDAVGSTLPVIPKLKDIHISRL